MPKIKKDSSVLHPNSRKALQLARQVFHKEKVEKRREETNVKQKLKLTKLKWFKENMDDTKEVYSAAEVKDLIHRYLNRFKEEIAKEDREKSLKRHISSPTFHNFKLKFFIEKEKQDFESNGLEVPDLMHKNAYSIFKNWNGDIQLLPAIVTVNISKKQLEKTMKQCCETPCP